MARPKDPPPKYKVGDNVFVMWGVDRLPGVIIEDRGCHGYRGRRLYRVSVPVDPEPLVFPVPEEEVNPPVPAAVAAPPRPAALRRGSGRTTARPKDPPPKYKVGDHVFVMWGVHRLPAVVIEDRGYRVGGRRLYRVSVPMDPEPIILPVPEDEVNPPVPVGA